MNLYKVFTDEINAFFVRLKQQNVFYKRIISGRIEVDEFASFLRNVSFLTSYTPVHLTLAEKVATQKGHAQLAAYFKHKRGEEVDHHRWGDDDIAALKGELHGQHKLACLIEGKKNIGVSVPKKPNCDAREELYIAGMYGMLGIPFSAETELDPCAEAAILGEQATGCEKARTYARAMLEAGKPVAFTDEFLRFTGFEVPEDAMIFSPKGDIWNLVEIPQQELDGLRNRLLKPYGVQMRARARVGLSLFDDDMEVLQNFNDEAVTVALDLPGRNGKARKVVLTLSEGQSVALARQGRSYTLTIPPRTLVVLS